MTLVQAHCSKYITKWSLRTRQSNTNPRTCLVCTGYFTLSTRCRRYDGIISVMRKTLACLRGLPTKLTLPVLRNGGIYELIIKINPLINFSRTLLLHPFLITASSFNKLYLNLDWQPLTNKMKNTHRQNLEDDNFFWCMRHGKSNKRIRIIFLSARNKLIWMSRDSH